MHIYGKAELKKCRNFCPTYSKLKKNWGFNFIMHTLLIKLSMLNCQFIRRTHCSNRSCFIGRPTKGLLLLGHFHFLLTCCAGAAAAASEKLVLSAKGRLVRTWSKTFCSEMPLFSCNFPFSFSLPIWCLGILFILHSSGCFSFLLTDIKPSDATVSCGLLLHNAILQYRVPSSGEFS